MQQFVSPWAVKRHSYFMLLSTVIGRPLILVDTEEGQGSRGSIFPFPFTIQSDLSDAASGIFLASTIC